MSGEPANGDKDIAGIFTLTLAKCSSHLLHKDWFPDSYWDVLNRIGLYTRFAGDIVGE